LESRECGNFWRAIRICQPVATNAEPANVEFLFERAHLAVLPRGGGWISVANRNHPDVYLKAAELLGVPPQVALV
jgi:beta-phosphoglucomutase-like phosphatase (HAD superfamily)